MNFNPSSFRPYTICKLYISFIVPFIFLPFCNQTAYSQEVNIGIFNDKPLKSIVISPIKGEYVVYGDNTTITTLKNSDAIYISLYNNRLLLRNTTTPGGYFATITIETKDDNGVLKVKPIDPTVDARTYNNNMVISVAFGRLLTVNRVNTDNYIAGVVDAETGPNASVELYKAQSVLARTYMFKNWHKHESEGFQLCDSEHCQAYKGRSLRNPLIKEATLATSGQVAVVNDTTLITAAFHANCGGYTESAENAWLSKQSYLVPVKDPFCQNSPAARWTTTISIDKWRTYLKSHGIRNAKSTAYINFNVVQTERNQYYIVGKDSVPYRQIRSDFKLRSGFFSVSASQKEITINGRGYGHGVGLCQEGAIHMAEIGYKYKDIIQYYFQGVKIVEVDSLGVK